LASLQLGFNVDWVTISFAETKTVQKPTLWLPATSIIYVISQISDRFICFILTLTVKQSAKTLYVEAERSFSSLNLIKTHLRTTMLDDRLSDIAMLSVHSQRANALDLDLVDNFTNKYPNCRIMLCYVSPVPPRPDSTLRYC